MKRECACPRARHEHGTTAAYTTCGCRCLPCRVVYDAKVRARRSGRDIPPRTEGWIPRDGTRRRLEALHAIGWSGGILAALLDTTFQNVHDIRVKPGLIYPGTADRIADLYDRLWDQAPAAGHVTKTKRWAARKGFLPPLAWDDEEIDDPAASPRTCSTPVIDEVAMERRIKGDHQPLTIPELAEAVLILHARGWSETAIARRLRMSGTRVGQIIDRDEAA